MTGFRDSELRRLDLTLLLVFLGLLKHRKGMAVAAELGLTQSAISQALRRLRDIFGDELFLRRPHGMEPTALALALEGPVRTAVTSLRDAIQTAEEFDPKADDGLLRIAALDAEQISLVPHVAARIQLEAPKMRISVAPLGRADAFEALGSGAVDVALGFFWDLAEGIETQLLYEEDYLVVGRRDLFPDGHDLTLNAYIAFRHLLVSPGGDVRGIVDDVLRMRGLTRHVVLSLPSFMPALATLTQIDAIATIPRRIAKRHAERFDLMSLPPPIEVRRFAISLAMHRRNLRHPRLRWVSHQITALCQEL